MEKSKKVLGIIPARYLSSRFPGKPLVDIGGKSMLRRVYEQAAACTLLDRIIIATDDSRILHHAMEFGAEALLTRNDHVSGTDRCAEVAAHCPEFGVCINIQGDEPFLNPAQIERVVIPLLQEQAEISTLAKPVQDLATLQNPNAVKVVFNKNGHALYFSRSPIPYIRDLAEQYWAESQAHYRHLGLYGFQRETLLEIALLPPSPLEKWEALEQLRWLENGKSIFVALTDEETIGIDTPEDVLKALEFLQGPK